MLTSVSSTAGIDFVKPKSIVDRDMLINPTDIEVNSDVAKSSSSSCTHRIGGLNPNLIPTMRIKEIHC